MINYSNNNTTTIFTLRLYAINASQLLHAYIIHMHNCLGPPEIQCKVNRDIWDRQQEL